MAWRLGIEPQTPEESLQHLIDGSDFILSGTISDISSHQIVGSLNGIDFTITPGIVFKGELPGDTIAYMLIEGLEDQAPMLSLGDERLFFLSSDQGYSPIRVTDPFLGIQNYNLQQSGPVGLSWDTFYQKVGYTPVTSLNDGTQPTSGGCSLMRESLKKEKLL